MTLFSYRLGIRIFALLGLLSFLLFIFGLDPESLSIWGIIFFFVSLWVVIAGISSLVLLFLYEKFIGETSTVHFIGTVLRQGSLIGTYGALLLALLYRGIFAWWIVLLLLAFLLLLEFTLRFIFHTTKD